MTSDDWPQSLTTAVEICRGSAWPSCVWWLPLRRRIGNAAWDAAFAPLQPAGADAVSQDAWPASGSRLGAHIERVLATGEPATIDHLAADDLGAGATPEASHRGSRWAVALSPLREAGGVQGVFATALLRDSRVDSYAHAEVLQGRRKGDRYSRALIASLPGSAAFVVDRSLRYLLAEGEALQGAGVRPSDLVGKTVREVLSPELATSYEAFYGAALGGKPFEHEHVTNGRHYLSRGVPLRNEQGEIDSVLAVSFDISDRKRAEEALRAADRHKNEFLATLAHELRNPLAPIRSALEAIALDAGMPATARRLHTIVRRQVDHMVRLIDDLLEISRISRGVIELRRAPVLLGDVVAMGLEASRPTIDAAGHRLDVELPAQPLWIDADAQRLAQALSNLLNNAARYTPSSGRLGLKVTHSAGALQIAVRDNGAGLEPEMRTRVFDLFTQVAPGQGGLGVGLTLVRDIARLHGGSVEARSAGLGQGSEFVIVLPAIESEPSDRPSDRPSHGSTHELTVPGGGEALAAPSSAQVKQRILVVDDNRDAADSLVLLLVSLGLDARGVYGGRSALSALDEAAFDAVLMDLGMPELDGFETLRQIRSRLHSEAVRVIALSGWGQEEDRRRVFAAGFDAHLTKPVDLPTLLAALDAEPAAPAGAEGQLPLPMA